MKSWLVNLFHKRSQKKAHRRAASFRPRLEVLEDRVTPTLTPHGGVVLASVQAQAVYLGSWGGSTIPTSVFDSFLNTLVSGTTTPYLAMLHNAGFAGVTGNGSAPLTGVQDNVSVPSTITDSQIQADLQLEISSSAVQQPNANTLYEVFVQPGSVVSIGNGETSVNTFLAYHSSFAGVNALKQSAEVRYAVIPFHGTAGNAQDPWLNQQDSMTVAASHETAEAVTDPDGQTYYDRYGEEVGDVVNGSTVYIPDTSGAPSGTQYAVQREGSLQASQYNFLPITPAGATAGHSTTFAVVSGALQVNEVVSGKSLSFIAANPSGETGTVVSISPTKGGIDDFGQPMVDVVFSDGPGLTKAYEYHDFPAGNPTAVANPSFFPWTYLASNVQQAVAGQGVSYVLLTNHSLGEYVDPNYFTYYYGFGVNPGARRGAVATNVASIAGVGLDQITNGGNAVTYTVIGKTGFYEWRDVNASATPSSSNPFSVTKHSEVLSSIVLTSEATQQTGVDVLVVSAPPAAINVLTVQPMQLTAPTPATAFTPANTQTAHFTLPDGGGGDSQAGDSSAEAPTTAATLADAPLLGPLFTEAVRQLKAAQSVVPSGWLPTAPMEHHDAPAPKNALPLPAPQGKKGVWTVPLGDLGASVLPVAAGLCGAGLEGEAKRRRLPARSASEG